MKDKILFFTDMWFFNFAVAFFLQKKYDAEFYAIFDVDDNAKKFFEKQELVNYKKTWFFLDHVSNFNFEPDFEYLKSFEDKYDINLWRIAYTERDFYQFNPFHKFTDNEILSILEMECKFFEKVIEEIKPDFLSTYITTLHYHELLYQICKYQGIKTLVLGPSKIGYRMMLSKKSLIMDNFQKTNKKITYRSFEALKDYLDNYNPYRETNEYTTKHFDQNIIQRYKPIINFFISGRTESYRQRYTNLGRSKSKVLQNKISLFFKKKYRNSFINKNFISTIDKYTPFIYFPLHQEPERNLLIDSPYYTNQIEVIKNISISLPVDYTLLVKEHPVQRVLGWRETSYYKQIMDMPNVIMVHPSVKPDILLKQCSLVITVTGTAGMEALFYKKSVILFTENFYSSIPSVIKIDHIENLPKTIQKALMITPNIHDVNNLVNLIEKNTFPANETGITVDFSYRFGFKGPIMDAELPLEEIKSFLDVHKLDFERMASEHLEKILIHKKSKSLNRG